MSIAFSLVVLSIAASPHDSWTAFRGDGTSVSTVEALPLNWSDDSGILWRIDVAGLRSI